MLRRRYAPSEGGGVVRPSTATTATGGFSCPACLRRGEGVVAVAATMILVVLLLIYSVFIGRPAVESYEPPLLDVEEELQISDEATSKSHTQTPTKATSAAETAELVEFVSISMRSVWYNIVEYWNTTRKGWEAHASDGLTRRPAPLLVRCSILMKDLNSICRSSAQTLLTNVVVVPNGNAVPVPAFGLTELEPLEIRATGDIDAIPTAACVNSTLTAAATSALPVASPRSRGDVIANRIQEGDTLHQTPPTVVGTVALTEGMYRGVNDTYISSPIAKAIGEAGLGGDHITPPGSGLGNKERSSNSNTTTEPSAIVVHVTSVQFLKALLATCLAQVSRRDDDSAFDATIRVRTALRRWLPRSGHVTYVLLDLKPRYLRQGYFPGLVTVEPVSSLLGSGLNGCSVKPVLLESEPPEYLDWTKAHQLSEWHELAQSSWRMRFAQRQGDRLHFQDRKHVVQGKMSDDRIRYLHEIYGVVAVRIVCSDAAPVAAAMASPCSPQSTARHPR